jgi:hypothetical protein
MSEAIMSKMLAGGAASGVATLAALASGPLALVVVVAGCLLLGVVGVALEVVPGLVEVVVAVPRLTAASR